MDIGSVSFDNRSASLLAGVVTIALIVLLGRPLTGFTAPLPGQIVVDPAHPAWLAYHQGGPFFLAGPGDPEGFLYRGSRNADGTRNGDQMALINKLIGTGANSMYLMAVRSHGGDGDSTQNPFMDPNNPASGLNPAILDQWEGWFTAMDNAGIVIYFIFYDDSARPFGSAARTTIGAAERAFIEGLVDRFEHHRHLIWNVAEEYGEAHNPTAVSQIAAIIRAADDHEHVIAVHQNDGIVFNFATDANIDQFAIQRNVPGRQSIHNEMVAAWNNAAGRFNLTMSESNAHYNAANRTATRQYSWAAAMGGAYVMVLGMDVASTPIEILQDHGRLVQFFESTSFNEMAPHDELASGGTEYVLANPGTRYIAYAANLQGEMGLQGLSAGTYNLAWFDIPTGTTVLQQDVSVAAGNQSWSRPAGIGTEVVLSAVRQGAALPSSPPNGGSALLQEAFDRSDSAVVGNNWSEVESPSAVTQLLAGTLAFETADDAFRPLIQHAFAAQTTGRLTWSFDLNFRRTGAEGTYAFWMQLGQGSLMSTANPTTAGVAVNLLWGSPNQGLSTHEGLGYVVNGAVTQIATVSGGPTLVTVEVDLEQQTYRVQVAGQQSAAIPFDNDVSIDTVRFFTDRLNRNNFAARQIDNVVVRQETTGNENPPPPPEPTLDTTPPSVSLTAPAPGTTVSGSISVSAQASDNEGVVGVQFRRDGSNLGTEDTSAPYSRSWDTTTVSDGLHTLSAIARDAAGNTASATAIQVVVNNTPITPVSISSFTATPTSLVAGGTVTLAWVTTNANSVAIDNGVGSGLPPTGNTDVSPVLTTTYTLTATGDSGTVSREVTITVSPAPVPNPDGSAFRQDSGADGLVVMEAEHFQANLAQGNHHWDLVQPTAASGNAAMQALPNSGTNQNTGYTSQSPRLDFEVQFAHAGTHFIWVRGQSASGSDDSVHVGLNGQATASSDRLSSFGSGWTWSRSTMDGPVATVVVPSAGTHTVNVWMREDGFVMDRLLLTTSATYQPSGAGPAESPRGSGSPSATPVTLALEAEDGTLSAAMAIGFDNSTSTTYIWVPDSEGDVLDPGQNGATASYPFDVPAADTYVIWGRVRPHASGTGSFFVAVDTDPYRVWAFDQAPSQTAGVDSVSNVSPTAYEVTLLHVGERYYIDRTFTITVLPAALDGLIAIKTANNDKRNQSAAFLTFTIVQNGILYIAYDARATRYPSWLTQSYTQTGQTINTSDVPLTVWQRSVSAGTVSVPGNQSGNPSGVGSNYLVLLALDGPGGEVSWVWDQAAAQSLPVVFLEAGSHLLTVKQRESGTQLDQLILTNELELVPAD